MPLTSRWGTESRTRDPLHLTSAPRPVVLDANRVTDSYRDFVCDDATKTGVFNLDCGAPPPPAPPVAGPGSLDAVIVGPFNISPYLGNSYDTEAEIFALQPTAPDGLVAYNESTHTLYIWVATQGLWHKFVWEFNIAPLEAFHTNFIGSAPVGNDNIKFAEDIDSLTVHDGTDWHRFKEEE